MYVILSVYSARLEAQAIVNENQLKEVKKDFQEMVKKGYELVDIMEDLESKYDCCFPEIECLVL